MRQKSDISERFAPFNLTLGHGRWVAVRPVGVIYTKNEYNLFYHKLDAEYFFIQQFFWKK